MSVYSTFQLILGPYRDCEVAYKHGVRLSGVYTIQPDEDQPFQVYCDMETDGSGWTVFNVGRTDRGISFVTGWTMPEELGT